MKKIRFYLTQFIIITLSILSISCQKDDETALTDSRDDISKIWRCRDSEGLEYSVIITKDETEQTQVLIENFQGLGMGQKIKATLTNNVLKIKNELAFGHTINGEGSISSNKKSIRWDYIINDGNDSKNMTSTFGDIVISRVFKKTTSLYF